MKRLVYIALIGGFLFTIASCKTLKEPPCPAYSTIEVNECESNG